MENQDPNRRGREFNFHDKLLQFAKKIEDSSDSVLHIYNAVKHYKSESIDPMDVDSFQFLFQADVNEPRESSTEKLKEKTLDWLYKQAFEDHIEAIREFLIESAYYAKGHAMSLEFKKHKEASTRVKAEEIEKEHGYDKAKEYFDQEMAKEFVRVEEKLKKAEKVSYGMSFPDLIETTISDCKINVPYVEELKSINQVRNCLVHRNAIVGTSDINDKEKSLLVLKYTEVVFIGERDGKEFEITLENKKDGGFIKQGPNGFPRQAIKTFKPGEKIKITPNLLNAVSYTCCTFINELYIAILEKNGIKVDRPKPRIF